MKEHGKISAFQLFCMVFLFIAGSSVILLTITAAGRDTWIGMLLAMGAGFFIAFVISYMAKKYPNRTLIDWCQDLFGKIAGKFVGILYLSYFLYLGALVLRNYGDLMSSVVMPETPASFFNLTLALVVAYLVYKQLEVISRVSELILPLFLAISFLTGFLIVISKISDFSNLLPLFERGIGKVLLGTVPIASFPYMETIVFAMIIPFVNSVKNRSRAFAGGIFFGGIFLTLILVQNLAVFGLYISTLTFPRFFAVRLIMVGDFIQRIEAGVLIIWVMSGVLKIGICLYAFVLGFSQITGISNYKSIIMPSTFIMIVLANISFKNAFEMLDFGINVYPVYAFPFQVLFPVLLLIMAIVKSKRKKTSG